MDRQATVVIVAVRSPGCSNQALFVTSAPAPLVLLDVRAIPATLVTASCAATPSSANCSRLMFAYLSAAPLSADKASWSSLFLAGMLGRRFMAVGETCVDAERTRRLVQLAMALLRQDRTAGIRSIARPLTRLVNRGTVATHGGIGLGDVHCSRACHVKVDVGSRATLGPSWRVHMHMHMYVNINHLSLESHALGHAICQMRSSDLHLRNSFHSTKSRLLEPGHLASKLLSFLVRCCPLGLIVCPAVRLPGILIHQCRHQ
jgi:hypothetical protein